MLTEKASGEPTRTLAVAGRAEGQNSGRLSLFAQLSVGVPLRMLRQVAQRRVRFFVAERVLRATKKRQLRGEGARRSGFGFRALRGLIGSRGRLGSCRCGSRPWTARGEASVARGPRPKHRLVTHVGG